MNRLFAAATVFLLAACATPEQQAARLQAQKRYEQNLQVALAAQCDRETAELMRRRFDTADLPSDNTDSAFKQRFTEKTADPMFQSCYKLAWQNHIAQEQLREVRRLRYYDDWGYPFYRPFWW